MVSRRAKALACCALVGVNLFFMYYTILHALYKGQSWQTQFLWACVTQVLSAVAVQCRKHNVGLSQLSDYSF